MREAVHDKLFPLMGSRKPAAQGGPLTSALTEERRITNLRIALKTLSISKAYLRSIEPSIAIVLVSSRIGPERPEWLSAQGNKTR